MEWFDVVSGRDDLSSGRVESGPSSVPTDQMVWSKLLSDIHRTCGKKVDRGARLSAELG